MSVSSEYNRRLRFWVVAGYAAMVVVAAAVLWQATSRLERGNSSQNEVFEQHERKSALLGEMRDVIQTRAIVLRNLLLYPDPFQRDEQLMAFHAGASRFIELRGELLETDLTDSQRSAVEELSRLTRSGSLFLRQIADTAAQGDGDGSALLHFLHQGRQIQDEVLEKIARLVAEQEAIHHAAMARALEADRKLDPLLWLEFGAGMLLGMVILVYVHRQVAMLGTQLQRQTERAEAASQAKGAFLANMSHEIRTPLNGVLGMLDLLARTPLNASQRDFTTNARDSAHALLEVLNDILDYSKADAGRMTLEAEPFDPLQVVERVFDMLSGVAAGKGLVLFYYVDPKLPARLIGDPGRLRQLLTNLVGNAIKYTDRGGEVWLRLVVEEIGVERVRVYCGVYDTGKGISPEDQQALFRPFSQGEAGRGQGRGGTGLGLTISRQLVQLMGGELALRSIPDRGSTFYFSVAFNLERKGQAPWYEELPSASVLVVGEYAHLRIWLVRQLEALGLRAQAVESGQEAKELVADPETRPGAILVDQRIAGDMDGASLVTDLRDTLGESLPIILMADPVWLGASSERFEAPACAILRRPVHPRVLVRALSQLMGGDVGAPPEGEESGAAAAPRMLRQFDLHVLVVDDEPVNRRVLELLLSQLGFEVDVAPDAESALNAWMTGAYDLVLMDAFMPGMDGFEATRTLRAMEADSDRGHTPVIGISASVRDEDLRRCIDEGMDEVLPKPIESDTLIALLERLPLRQAARSAQSSGSGAVALSDARASLGDSYDELFTDLKLRLPTMMEGLSEQLGTEAYGKLANGAHQVRGAAASLGLAEVSRHAAALEVAARDSAQRGAAATHLEALEAEVAKLL